MAVQKRGTQRTSPRRAAGFTLIELMIVVAVLGLLAAIAVPAFSKYVKKSRTAEAIANLEKMWVGAVRYYETDFMDTGTPAKALPKQFPWGNYTPSGIECGCRQGGKCSPAGAPPFTLVLLDAYKVDPHVYRAAYSGSGVGTGSRFTATQQGDLDCDGTLSFFGRVGSVDANGNVTGSGQAPWIIDELE